MSILKYETWSPHLGLFPTGLLRCGNDTLTLTLLGLAEAGTGQRTSLRTGSDNPSSVRRFFARLAVTDLRNRDGDGLGRYCGHLSRTLMPLGPSTPSVVEPVG